MDPITLSLLAGAAYLINKSRNGCNGGNGGASSSGVLLKQ